MGKTIMIDLDEQLYHKIEKFAENDHQSIERFIETVTLKYIRSEEFADESEMESIHSDPELVDQLRQGSLDAEMKKGKFVE